MRKMKGRARALALAGATVAMVLASMAQAGNLDPSAPPAPTMKTLDEIPPTWSQFLPAASRFKLVLEFNAFAVLDKETGLVWERTPATSGSDFNGARGGCIVSSTGGRLGWRLPTAHELLSLLDLTVAAGQARLPAGHPFVLPASGTYWTSSPQLSPTDGQPAGVAYVVDPFATQFLTQAVLSDSTNTILHWCVRGGSRTDGF